MTPLERLKHEAAHPIHTSVCYVDKADLALAIAVIDGEIEYQKYSLSNRHSDLKKCVEAGAKLHAAMASITKDQP